MLKLILVIMVPLAVSFTSGYVVRDWMSRRRRKEVRKKFYERYKPAQKIDPMTGISSGERTVQALHEQLSKLEDRIANALSEIAAFRDETRSEFIATRELLHRSFDGSQHSNYDGRVLVHYTSGKKST